MANKSWNLTTAKIELYEMQPDQISTGTNAPTNDVEVRVNLSNVKNNFMIIRALRAIIRRLEDGRLASNDTGLI